MNILLLVPTMETPGGTQKLVADLGRLLAERHRVVECSFDSTSTGRAFESGNTYVPIGDSGSGVQGRAARYVRLARRLSALKNAHRIDVVVSFLWAADFVNRLSPGSAKRISVCVVNIEGNFQNRQLLRHRRFAGFVYRRFDRVVAINADLAAEMVRLFRLRPERVATVHPFIEGQATTPGTPSPMLPQSRVRIGWLGRLNPIKNLRPLIELMPRILRRVPHAQLLVIGEGPEHEQIAESVRHAGLRLADGEYSSEADVVLLGFVDDAHAYLAQCDVFALTSKSEGFGLAIAEAMSLGLPVLASDCPTGGPHLILEGSTAFKPGRTAAEETPHGFLMPIPDSGNATEVWEPALVRMLTDQSLRVAKGASAKRRAAAFSKDALTHEWFGILDAL